MRRSSLFVSALGLALAVSGCPTSSSDDAAVVDAFRVRRDAGTTDDSGTDIDADLDAYVAPDANEDADVDAYFDMPDSPTTDAYAEPDTGLGESDGGPCVSTEDTGLDTCDCITLGDDCSATSCVTGEFCVDDGCGEHCQASGSRCGSASDCGSGATCSDGHCVRSGACVDSRDCALGFACESGVCQDRRIGCTLADLVDTCPFNYTCNALYGAPFCERELRPCTTDASCSLGRCVDVDGDGDKECARLGFCDSTSDCSDGNACGVEPSRLSIECLPTGVCRTSAQCGSGYTCVDLWGDGTAECVLSGGTCDSQSDCPAGSLCASPYEGGAPTCIDRPLSI